MPRSTAPVISCNLFHASIVRSSTCFGSRMCARSSSSAVSQMSSGADDGCVVRDTAVEVVVLLCGSRCMIVRGIISVKQPTNPSNSESQSHRFQPRGHRECELHRLRTAVCTAPLRREPTRLRCILVAGQNSRYSLCLVYYEMADAAGEGTCMPHHGYFLK